MMDSEQIGSVNPKLHLLTVERWARNGPPLLDAVTKILNHKQIFVICYNMSMKRIILIFLSVIFVSFIGYYSFIQSDDVDCVSTVKSEYKAQGGRIKENYQITEGELVITNVCDKPIMIKSAQFNAYLDARHEDFLTTVTDKEFEPSVILNPEEDLSVPLIATISGSLFPERSPTQSLFFKEEIDWNWL